MGESKRRGTYEQRKAAAEEREAKQRMLQREIDLRKPSPKHTALMTTLLGLTVGASS